MATFKIVVQHQRSDGLYQVYIRLTHNRKSVYLKTDKMVTSKGVIKGTHEVRDPFVLNALDWQIGKWIISLNQKNIMSWSVSQVRDFLLSDAEDVCYSDFARDYILSLSDTLQPSSLNNYYKSVESLENYCGTPKLMFGAMTTQVIQGWIDSMKKTKSAKSLYPIYVKKIFNEGIAKYNDYDNDIVRIKINPWTRVSFHRQAVPNKRAITMEDCRRIFSVVPCDDGERLALDVCKMVLCLAGINVIDLYRMKKKDYYDGILHYERSKTKTKRTDKAYIEMRAPDMLLSTIEKYLSKKNDEFLFDFHQRYNTMAYFNVRIIYFLRRFCKNTLKDEALHITPYTFRHTWATIAQNDVGANYEEIGFALNHISTHKITMGYVKPDFTRAWELNEKVVEKIFFTNDKSKRLEEHHIPVFGEIDEATPLSADAYFMGEVVAHVEGCGYHHTDEVIDRLMDKIGSDVPKQCTVQIKIINKMVNIAKYFERLRE